MPYLERPRDGGTGHGRTSHENIIVMPSRLHSSFSLFLIACSTTVTAADDANSLTLALRAVGRDGAGQAAATDASRKLAALGPDALLDVLRAMDGAPPDALNWL